MSIFIVIAVIAAPAFGMKRQRAVSVKKLILSENDVIICTLNTLDKLCQEAMPSLWVEVSGNDYKKLPLYEKLNLLSSLDQKNREKIDSLQVKINELLNSLPLDIVKKRIKDVFKKMEELLEANERNAENELRNAYNIDPLSKLWLKYMQELEARKKFDLAAMKEQWNTTQWHPGLSQNLVKGALEAMEENGINPTALEVAFIEDREFLKTSSAVFYQPQSHPTLLSFGDNPFQTKRWVYKKDVPGSIKLHPYLFTESQDCIKHIMHHEIMHGIKNHGIIRTSFLNGIKACARIDYEDIRLHPAYTKLVLAQEISADTSRALKDSDVARCGVLYPALYSGSYGMLATANTHWIALDLLDKK